MNIFLAIYNLFSKKIPNIINEPLKDNTINIGEKWTLYPNNPFNTISVEILNIKNNYVQYRSFKMGPTATSFSLDIPTFTAIFTKQS